MKKITAVLHFDSTNETRLQFSEIDTARQWVYRMMQHHPLAQYSIYRNSTNRLLVQWESGRLTINRVGGEMGRCIAGAGGAIGIAALPRL